MRILNVKPIKPEDAGVPSPAEFERIETAMREINDTLSQMGNGHAEVFTVNKSPLPNFSPRMFSFLVRQYTEEGWKVVGGQEPAEKSSENLTRVATLIFTKPESVLSAEQHTQNGANQNGANQNNAKTEPKVGQVEVVSDDTALRDLRTIQARHIDDSRKLGSSSGALDAPSVTDDDILRDI